MISQRLIKLDYSLCHENKTTLQTKWFIMKTINIGEVAEIKKN